MQRQYKICYGSSVLRYEAAIKWANYSNAYTQLRMCSLGAKEVAAVDSCFALVRARQHCIARH